MVDTFLVFPVDRLGQGVAERVEQEIALRERRLNPSPPAFVLRLTRSEINSGIGMPGKNIGP